MIKTISVRYNFQGLLQGDSDILEMLVKHSRCADRVRVTKSEYGEITGYYLEIDDYEGIIKVEEGDYEKIND